MCDLVIGIDPDKNKIPQCYKQAGVTNLYQWGEDILNVCKNKVIAAKFQSAYFESFGLYGLECLTQLIQLAKANKMKVIMDAKRGDIGSTSEAYARAYLNPVNDQGSNEFESDFLTINPLMGEDSMMPFIETAIKYKKGIFILLETSNPGAGMILKEKSLKNEMINFKIASFIQKNHNDLNLKRDEFGPIGCVIGATNKDSSHWREKLPNSLFLMPGIGAQGGDWQTIKSCLNYNNKGVWIPISRGITFVKENVTNRNEYVSKVKENLDQIIYHKNKIS